MPPNRPSLETLNTRVSALEERMDVFDFEQRQIKAELQSNTALTEEIHGDTKELVAATKWLSTTKYLMLTVFIAVSGASGAIVAVSQAYKALSGH